MQKEVTAFFASGESAQLQRTELLVQSLSVAPGAVNVFVRQA